MNPVLDNIQVFTTGGTNAFTVGSNYSQVMIVWAVGNGGSNPNTAPTVTYNGSALTFIAGSENTFYFTNSPWIGYLVNPSQGTHNIVAPNQCAVAVFHNVDQGNPIPFYTSAASGQASTSPRVISISTQYDNSLLLKSAYINGALGLTTANGSGETGGLITGGTGTDFRYSYKPTTTAGNYSMSTSWSGGGTTGDAGQVAELKWSGSQVTSTSVNVANSVSRLATVNKVGTYFRAISDSVSNAAGRFSSPARFFGSVVSVNVANAASRLATVVAVLRVYWHGFTKNNGVWSNPNKIRVTETR